MKMIKIATEIPRGRDVNRNSILIRNIRLTDTRTISRTTGRRANKEYNISVYRYPDGDYGVIVYYGRIGGTLQTDWRGSFTNRIMAGAEADSIAYFKRNSPGKNYVESNVQNNINIPGIREPEAPRPAPNPVLNPNPRPQPAPNPVLNPQPRPQLAPDPVPNPQSEKKQIPQEERKPISVKKEVKDDDLEQMDWDLQDIMGKRKSILLKMAQAHPNARPEDFGHGTHDLFRQQVSSGVQVPAGISTNLFFTFQVRQQGGMWFLTKGEGIFPQQMEVVAQYQTKDQAIDAAVANVHEEEDRYARQQQEVEERGKEEKRRQRIEKEDAEQKVKEPPRKEEVKDDEEDLPAIDPDLDEIIGKAKNWYKVSQKNEKTLR